MFEKVGGSVVGVGESGIEFVVLRRVGLVAVEGEGEGQKTRSEDYVEEPHTH